MRTSARATCTLLVVSITLFPLQSKIPPQPSPPDTKQKYFPPGVFATSSRLDDSDGYRYAECLNAMGEPSLLQASRDPELEIYRFLWLRTFDHPMTIRVHIRPNGLNELSAVELSGQAGYDLGKISKRSSFKISETQLREFSEHLEKSHFWSLPTTEEHPNQVHLDGAEWILEGVKDGKYHVVVRWSPETGNDYRALCLSLLALSQLKVDPKEIY
jgi:hypothetical protein